MNNDKKISIFFLIFVAFFIGCFFFASKNGLREPLEKEEVTEIKKYAIQTSEYFSDLNETKYVISSIDELNVFNTKFKVDLNIDKDVFKNNVVFVELEEVPSSGIKKEITDLLIDDNIIFVIKTDSDATMTDDMALWYYVAIIPNKELSGVNYDEWINPSQVIVANNNYDYIIETDSKYLTMQDDGGSNINIYYQIDSHNNIIIKNQEEYHANLGGQPETIKSKLYEKNITIEQINMINDIYTKDDIKDSDIPFKINNKDIYNSESISLLHQLLEQIDKT